MQTSAKCTHPNAVKTGRLRGACFECDGRGNVIASVSASGRGYLVNGYALSAGDYELVKGYRRERDRLIDAARADYQEKLAALLELVKRSTVTNG